MARKFITETLTEKELKELRAKSFPERNKIIQDKLARIQKERIIKLRMEKNRKDFIF